MENNVEKKLSAKHEFDNKAYKKYMLRLRYDTDADLIDYIDEEITRLKAERKARGGGKNVGITEVIKDALYTKIYGK